MAAILKQPLSQKLCSEYFVSLNLEIIVIENFQQLCIFYFMVILPAILAAILDFFKMLKDASLAPTGFVKSKVWGYQNGNKPLWDLQCKVTCHFLQTISKILLS